MRPGRIRIEHGPLSLVAAARWPDGDRPATLRRAGDHAVAVLASLAAVRAALSVDVRRIRNLSGLPPVARDMVRAARRFPAPFITPLVAVAGAVADAVADFLVDRGADWAVVSNGGDVAVRLPGGGEAGVALYARIGASAPAARFTVRAADGVGGVATSGTGGRSLTLGVADAAAVFAPTAAQADAAATLVANAVAVDSPAVERVLAEHLDPDTDLRGIRVTRRVGPLTPGEVARALDRGRAAAQGLVDAGLVRGAVLSLRGRWRFVGWPGEAGVTWMEIGS